MWGIAPDEFETRAAAGTITPADVLEVYWLSGFQWQSPKAVQAYVFRESMMERRKLREELEWLVKVYQAEGHSEDKKAEMLRRIEELQEKLDPED